MPLSESVDRLLQIALILITYYITYLVTHLITQGITAVAPGAGKTLTPLFWGFNFITGSLVAMGARGLMGKLRDAGIMTRQYQNNYLLNRVSGLAFDLMIVAGIASIDIADLQGLWAPFLLMAVIGGVVTLLPEMDCAQAVSGLCGRKLYSDVRDADRHHQLGHPAAAPDRSGV